jgi:hypothetical protein
LLEKEYVVLLEKKSVLGLQLYDGFAFCQTFHCLAEFTQAFSLPLNPAQQLSILQHAAGGLSPQVP